uniref:hypothetical protein n=1 Tax=Trichocoleus desertorum TaxID=1481672 RepID=UPI0025B438CE|nr:hypothetical protein [Trichocoleus desertorum]
MRTINLETSACRHCRYYTPEGRRGGSCQQLNVPVRGAWKACSLAIPPFAPSWENSEEIMNWSESTLILGDVISLDCSPISFSERKDDLAVRSLTK